MKRHPVTGRLSLFADQRHAFGVQGMTPEESEKFLFELTSFACQPPRVYEHNWKVGDLVLWDNRFVLHKALAFDKTQLRRLKGVRVHGDPVREMQLNTPGTLEGREVLRTELERLKGKGGILPGTNPPTQQPQAAL